MLAIVRISPNCSTALVLDVANRRIVQQRNFPFTRTGKTHVQLACDWLTSRGFSEAEIIQIDVFAPVSSISGVGRACS